MAISHLCCNGMNIENIEHIENIELSSSEILPVYLPDRLYLSVAVTGIKYCVFGQLCFLKPIVNI